MPLAGTSNKWKQEKPFHSSYLFTHNLNTVQDRYISYTLKFALKFYEYYY